MKNRFEKIVTIEKDIRAGKVEPVYFFYGEEPYYIENMVRLLINTAVDSNVMDFNLDILRSEETSGDAVVTLASSYPMMSEKRVVVVKNIQKMSAKSKTRIESYINNPNPSCTLIMTAGSINAKTALYKRIKKNCTWFESPRLYDNEAAAWLIKKFKRNNITLSHEAASYIVSLVGTSQWALFNESEKIKLYIKNKSNITADDIAGLVGSSKLYTGWELTESVYNSNLERSIEIASNVLRSNTYSAVGLIASLSERALTLLQIKTLKEKGVNQRQIQSAIPMWPFLFKRCMVQESNFTKKDLFQIIDTLVRADAGLKTGAMDRMTMLLLVIHSIIKKEKVLL